MYERPEAEPENRISLTIPQKDCEALKGITDLHIHVMPSFFTRPFYDIDIVRDVRDVGYSAVVFKCHHTMTADRAQLLMKLLPGIKVFGGVVLNHSVGGLNPEAVEAAIAFGAKVVWMPTMHAANHINYFGVPTYPMHRAVVEVRLRRRLEGISVLDADGELFPEVHDILAMVADANIILGTCHLSLKEIYALVEAARDSGVKKILVTHPEWGATKIPVEDQVKLADMGAIIEHAFNACMPYGERFDPRMMAKAIQAVGAERCVMSTDFGQWHNPHPVEGMRQFIHTMMACGITMKEIEAMTKENPASLLSL